jgi:hypothetical protein
MCHYQLVTDCNINVRELLDSILNILLVSLHSGKFRHTYTGRVFYNVATQGLMCPGSWIRRPLFLKREKL